MRKHSSLHFGLLAVALAIVMIGATVLSAGALGVIAAILTSIAFVFNLIFALAEFLCGDADALFFTLTAVVLQAAMLVSPIYGPRTVLCSVVLILVPTAKNIVGVFSSGAQRMKIAPRRAATFWPSLSALLDHVPCLP